MAGSDKYRIETITKIDEFEAIASRFDELAMGSAAGGFFLTSGWLSTWIKHYLKSEDELFVLAVFKDGRLVGVAPWYIRRLRKGLLRWRSVELIGSHGVGSDYLDVVNADGHAHGVAGCIYGYLFGKGADRWDCLSLADVPSQSFFLCAFLQLLDEAGKYVRVSAGAFCPIAALPAGWDSYYSSLSSNRREQFSRHARLLSKSGNVDYLSITHTHPRYSEYCQYLYKLHRERWPSQAAGFYTFLDDVLHRPDTANCAQLNVMEVGAKPVAMLLHFRYRDSVFMYLNTVDRNFNPKISVGNVAVGMALEQTAKSGVRHYDFLRGAEAYKFHWANRSARSIGLLVYQRRPVTLLLQAITCAKDLMKVASR